MWALLTAVVNHRWFQFSDMFVVDTGPQTSWVCFIQCYFSLFSREMCSFFFHWVGLWVMTSTLCFFIHRFLNTNFFPPNPPPTGDGENAISNFSLLECLCISLWKAVVFWGFFVQPDDLGFFWEFFVQRKIQWWLGWFEELEPEILGETKMSHLFEMVTKWDSGVRTTGEMFFF